ncbi:hypothetical protein [Sphingobacterium faecale]|uniref:Uncharacterized protein n=1 Tax=Sphingobacterium faecale TaxID=2803775 RepID=A0ABS1R174_9SPHI|nr:hypothetical protein [Sphingobacterium faecale]MBL1408447.1 hypothetical protein [Sphingobacterium faecale]
MKTSIIVVWVLTLLSFGYGQHVSQGHASGLIGFKPVRSEIVAIFDKELRWDEDEKQLLKIHNRLATQYPISAPFKFEPKTVVALLGEGSDGLMELVLHFESKDFKLSAMLNGLQPSFFKERTPFDNKSHPYYFEETLVNLFAAPFLSGTDFTIADPEMGYTAAITEQETGPVFSKESENFHLSFTHASLEKVIGSLIVSTGTEMSEIEAEGGLLKFTFSIPVNRLKEAK